MKRASRPSPDAAPQAPESATMPVSPKRGVKQRVDGPRILPSMRKRATLFFLPIYPMGVDRPKTRGDCLGGERPCPFVTCRHHLYLDVTKTGAIRINFPGELDEMPGTCSLDAADDGPRTLDETGKFVNLTRERTRQLESEALKNAARAVIAMHGDRPGEE
jgi:hypothetical protein